MPRPRRICSPGLPVHIVQRGNNRQDCFLTAGDRLRYLGQLQQSSTRYAVQVHAYVLMSNHVHLLVTSSTETGVSRMLQYLGRCYVSSFNRIHQRTGTLWEGRFRSSVIDSERYLFACYRYIELNPVRAGLVENPADYPWSSYRTNALGARNPVVQPRREWIEMGSSPDRRQRQYRALFDVPLEEPVLNELRANVR